MAESKYIDYMEELSKEDIYEGLLGHGLFSEKLPPILTSETFCQYCMDHRISAQKNIINISNFPASEIRTCLESLEYHPHSHMPAFVMDYQKIGTI